MTSPNAEPMRNPDVAISSADAGEVDRVDMLDAIALPAPGTIQRGQLRFSPPPRSRSGRGHVPSFAARPMGRGWP